MSSSAYSTRVLDHIIHLSPPGRLDPTISHFEKLGFNQSCGTDAAFFDANSVLPGGRHADGLTHNALVVLADGVYLELIAFIHEVQHYPEGTPERSKRESHWWATKRPGWIDWANLGVDMRVSETINKRAIDRGIDIHYDPPREGGRVKPDGIELKWRVTFPAAAHGRGSLPFFCEDVTPRERRVPKTDVDARHPNQVLGVAYVKLQASTPNFQRLSEQLTVVLGTPPSEISDREHRWTLQRPTPRHDHLRDDYPLLILATTDGNSEQGSAETSLAALAEIAFQRSDGQSMDGGGVGAILICPPGIVSPTDS